MVQTERHTQADCKTPHHEAKSDGFTPDELMNGAQSKALRICRRTGLLDSTTLSLIIARKLLIFHQLAIAI